MADPMKRLQSLVEQLQVELTKIVSAPNPLLPPEAKAPPHTNKPKLSASDAQHIRDLVRQGYKQAEVARAYDVHHATISRIIRGVYYK